MTLTETYVDLDTTRGKMRVHLFLPTTGKRYPAVIFYSEIFQVTGPIRRMAAALSGEGYLVAVPEVYHEFEPSGTVLAYDQAGSDRGNDLKYRKELASYDEDASVTARFLSQHSQCTGAIASFGVCLGGHLAIRAAFEPLICAAAAFYPTDVHSATLGAGRNDDTPGAPGNSEEAALPGVGTPRPSCASRGAAEDRGLSQCCGCGFRVA
jgi:carboxymethylenebutenolidase